MTVRESASRLARSACCRHAASFVHRSRAWKPSRQAIDDIARALVTGRRGRPRRVDAFADLVAAQNRLEVMSAPVEDGTASRCAPAIELTGRSVSEAPR